MPRGGARRRDLRNNAGKVEETERKGRRRRLIKSKTKSLKFVI